MQRAVTQCHGTETSWQWIPRSIFSRQYPLKSCRWGFCPHATYSVNTCSLSWLLIPPSPGDFQMSLSSQSRLPSRLFQLPLNLTDLPHLHISSHPFKNCVYHFPLECKPHEIGDHDYFLACSWQRPHSMSAKNICRISQWLRFQNETFEIPPHPRKW